MKIQVANIPYEGIELDFSQKDGWVREKIVRALGKLYRPGDPISGHLSVRQTLENVSIKGRIRSPAHAVCDRCLKPFDFYLELRCERLLTPLFASEDRRKGEKDLEVELTQDDLDFSYYKGEEIDAGEILAEQIVLEKPMTHLCPPECKGHGPP